VSAAPRDPAAGPRVKVRETDARDEGLRALVEEWAAVARGLSAPDVNHALEADALVDPDVVVFGGFLDGDLVGCGALKRLGPDHAEVKSLYLAPRARRRGVASAILQRIEGKARLWGVERLSLETGSNYHAAIALYRRFGFRECGAFSDYKADPASLFLTKRLSDDA
jgi:putative acetyltransferase